MYDLIIIGAGPGGYELAIKASKQGLKTLLIEKNEVGGTCLNFGCIPTKTYFHSAKVINQVGNLPEFNNTSGIDFSTIKVRKNRIVNNLILGIKQLLMQWNVELIYGEASFINKNTIEVNGTEIVGQSIVIATGSLPRQLNIPGINNPNVITSKELLDINEIPKELIIIGGGVIGIEMACIFKTFGSNVTIIEADTMILSGFDKEIIRRFQTYLKSFGIKVITKAVVKEVKENQLLYQEGTNITDIYFDKILLAIGRIANTKGLNLTEIGIITENNNIVVNDNFQTNLDNIYAIGDVNGKLMLAHYATYSGYRVLNHLLGQIDRIQFHNTPSCVFAFPEIAAVGLSEETCKKTNLDYQVIKQLYRSNGKAQAIEETDGFIKVIIDKEGLILGAHILGADANLLIHDFVIMMNAHISLKDAKNYIFAHPTLSELITSAINQYEFKSKKNTD